MRRQKTEDGRQILINPKGSYGLHKGSFRLQTMTALIKSFCGGVQGGRVFQKAPPLAPRGRRQII
jgi:hypothetical protein